MWKENSHKNYNAWGPIKQLGGNHPTFCYTIYGHRKSSCLHGCPQNILLVFGFAERVNGGCFKFFQGKFSHSSLIAQYIDVSIFRLGVNFLLVLETPHVCWVGGPQTPYTFSLTWVLVYGIIQNMDSNIASANRQWMIYIQYLE